MANLSIDKGTTISISIVVLLITTAFFVGMINSKTDRNEDDIQTVVQKLDTEIQARHELNRNMVELTARLDSFNERLDDLGNANATLPAAPQSTVQATDLQPAQTSRAVQPALGDPPVSKQPKTEAPNRDPEPEQPQQNAVSQVLDGVVALLGGLL